MIPIGIGYLAAELEVLGAAITQIAHTTSDNTVAVLNFETNLVETVSICKPCKQVKRFDRVALSSGICTNEHGQGRQMERCVSIALELLNSDAAQHFVICLSSSTVSVRMRYNGS